MPFSSAQSWALAVLCSAVSHDGPPQLKSSYHTGTGHLEKAWVVWIWWGTANPTALPWLTSVCSWHAFLRRVGVGHWRTALPCPLGQTSLPLTKKCPGRFPSLAPGIFWHVSRLSEVLLKLIFLLPKSLCVTVCVSTVRSQVKTWWICTSNLQ